MKTIFFYKKISAEYIENVSTQFLKDYINFEVDRNLFALGFRFRSEPLYISEVQNKHLIYNLNKMCFVKINELNGNTITGYLYNCYS